MVLISPSKTQDKIERKKYTIKHRVILTSDTKYALSQYNPNMSENVASGCCSHSISLLLLVSLRA